MWHRKYHLDFSALGYFTRISPGFTGRGHKKHGGAKERKAASFIVNTASHLQCSPDQGCTHPSKPKQYQYFFKSLYDYYASKVPGSSFLQSLLRTETSIGCLCNKTPFSLFPMVGQSCARPPSNTARKRKSCFLHKWRKVSKGFLSSQ